jgi:N-acetyl-anhydromuramyl-L-alanine amidase AmpD
MEKLTIELQDWDHTCGDGCCTTYGTDIYLNGEKLEEQYADNSTNALKAVLEKLGYEVEINQ